MQCIRCSIFWPLLHYMVAWFISCLIAWVFVCQYGFFMLKMHMQVKILKLNSCSSCMWSHATFIGLKRDFIVLWTDNCLIYLLLVKYWITVGANNFCNGKFSLPFNVCIRHTHTYMHICILFAPTVVHMCSGYKHRERDFFFIYINSTQNLVASYLRFIFIISASWFVPFIP